MHFHVFPHPTHRAGRQSAVCLRCCRQRRNIDRVQARARVQVAVRSIARGTDRVIGWSYKRGPAVIAAGDQQSRRDIGPVLAPEELDITLEDRPQTDTRAEPAIIEQEGRARDPVRADDALAAVNRQQHACSTSLRRRYRDDPLSAELLAKKSLFRSEEHTSELQSRQYLVCRLLLEKKTTRRSSHYASIMWTAYSADES